MALRANHIFVSSKKPRNSAVRLDITGNEIDDILDELDEIELKHQNSLILQHTVNWSKIIKQIRNGNTEFIKNLITEKHIDINAQHPDTNKTLLIYAVILSTIEMVQSLLEFGADVHIYDNDNKNALCYAKEIGDYKLIELLYYQQLSPNLRTNLQEITAKIHERNKAAEMMRSFQYKAGNDYIKIHSVITKYMIEAIKNRYEFTDDMLYYAWYFEIHPDNHRIDGYEPDTDSDTSVYLKQCKTFKRSLLWKTMMKTFEEIIGDTTDTAGWKWLKKYFIPSLIWYLPRPILPSDTDGGNTDDIMKNTLFYELWKRVKGELKKQSQILKDKVNSIGMESFSQWNELITYNITNTKYPKDIRQDSCGCLVPKYTEKDLSHDVFDTSFDARKYYDTTIYLNALIFRANILNSTFQTDMKHVTKDICTLFGVNVRYRAGAVKTLESLQRIVSQEYMDAIYPTAGALLNVNTCYLEFISINDIIKYMKIFEMEVKNQRTGCIVDILRCDNKWSMFDAERMQYVDISLNVLVKAPNDSGTIVSEIKLCLNLMCAFKRTSDKLRCIERVAESIYYHAILTEDMSDFMFWGFSDTNTNTTFIRTVNDEGILNKLKCVYMEDDTRYLIQILKESMYDMNKMQMIFVYNYIESFRYILHCTALNVKDIMTLLIGNKALKDLRVSMDGDVSDTARELLQYIQNDRKPLLNVLRFSDETEKTLFMSICEIYGDNYNDILGDVIVDNAVLSEEDYIDLLLMRDKDDKTALFYSFKSGNCDLMIDALRDHKDVLIVLLSQETRADGICLKQCPSTKTMRNIMDIMDDDDVISKLLSETIDCKCFCGGEKDAKQLLLHWNNYYFNYNNYRIYENETDDINMDTFAALCYLRKYDEIKQMNEDQLQRLLFTKDGQHTNDNEEKDAKRITLDNAADASSGECESKTYEEINTATTDNDENVNPNETKDTKSDDTQCIVKPQQKDENVCMVQFVDDGDLLNLLLLNNATLSDDDKYKILIANNSECRWNACHREILRYFKDDRSKLLQLFEDWKDIESLRFILNNDCALRMEDKVDILLSDDVLHDAFKGGFGSEIIKHFMNDKEELNKILFYENDRKQIAMMEIYKKNNKCNDTESLKLLLSDEFNVEKLVSHSDINGYCLLHYMMQNIRSIECVFDLIKYVLEGDDDGHLLLMKLLSQKTETDGDTVLMKGIQYNLENGKRILRYNKVNKTTFECMEAIFNVAKKDKDDREIISEFLKTKNNKDVTLYEMSRLLRQYEIERLIEQFQHK